MTTRPFKRFRLATNPNFTGAPAPYNGLLSKIDPSTGRQQEGYYPRGGLPAQEANALFGNVFDRLEVSDDFNLANWHPFAKLDVTGATMAFTSVRADGSVQARWDDFAQFWAVPGLAEDGKFVMGGEGLWFKYNSGQARRYNVAQPTGTAKVILWNADPNGAGNVIYDVFDTTTAAWTTGSVFTGAGAAPWTVTSSVRLSTGRIVAVGAGGGSDRAWYSDNNGTSWTMVTLPTTLVVPRRVYVGKNDLLFAFTGPADASAVWWTSTDLGLTWTARTSLSGYDHFKDAVYLPGFDKWIITTDAELLAVTDPANDPITLIAAVPGQIAMAAWNDLTTIAVSTAGRETLISSRDGFTGPTGFVFRNASPTARCLASNPYGGFLAVVDGALRESLRVF